MTNDHAQRGVLYGVAAYGCWGLIALYFKAVASVRPLEVLAHRVAWSFAFLAIVITLVGRWGDFRRCLASRRAVVMLLGSTLFIGANWLTFIYAVGSRHTVDASLGYFINPLVNVTLGTIFLGERLRPLQWVSIALALGGVGVLTILLGALPWISLVLAFTFAFYGLLRKTMPAGGLIGLTVETLLLTPLCVVYLGWLHVADRATGTSLALWALLAASGAVTSLPLLLFTEAARRLPLSTMGILQYITPTMQFLVGVFLFGEPFSQAQLLGFALIWIAVGIYVADSLRHAQRKAAVLDLVEPD